MDSIIALLKQQTDFFCEEGASEEAIRKADPRPAFAAISFMTNSASGLRQMFPWQMNMIRIISRIASVQKTV